MVGAARKLEKVLVVSKADPSKIEKVLVGEGFRVVDMDPDFVVCFGGDGTVLFGERSFPGVPKLIVKTSRVCRKCDYTVDKLAGVLSRIRAGDYRLHGEMKLVAESKGVRLVGLNEIQVHIKLPISAVRFSVSVDGKEYNDLIGDGVIVATPFGSTGYYEATGGERFERGIGVSFNNLHRRKVGSFVVSEDSVVRLVVSRGPAWLLADNDRNFVELNGGDSAVVRKADGVANFIVVSGV
ncbi:MAG: NAD(+)/NADH kinase [Candidatus Bathyarchaeum sp.]|nr:MAG: NAD(+)/NADH kinase [Candidatus Bathyarchaeum sp.]